MLKLLTVGILCLAFIGCLISGSFARSPTLELSLERFSGDDSDQSEPQAAAQTSDYQNDINRLIALRSRPVDELIPIADQLEAKWQRLDWNQYAMVMSYVCSEISNRGLNDARIRELTEQYARVALSHSRMFLWEHQASLVGALGYQHFSLSDSAWLRARRERVHLWLQTWQRLEKEFDPTFDINDRKQLPSLSVTPPYETGLPAGTPPSAIKDPKLRARYEAAIVENNRKADRVNRQLPLLARGPSFTKRAEYVLIYLYSQPPFRNAELRRYLESYIKDAAARKRILDAVEKSTK